MMNPKFEKRKKELTIFLVTNVAEEISVLSVESASGASKAERLVRLAAEHKPSVQRDTIRIQIVRTEIDHFRFVV